VRALPRRFPAVLQAGLIAAALFAGYAATAGPQAAASATGRAARATAHLEIVTPLTTSRDAVTQPRTAALPPAQVTLTTARGQTLSSIAAEFCGKGHASFWPEIWWANRSKIKNPNVLPARTQLVIPPCRPVRPRVAQAALAAIPPPPRPPAPPATVQAPAPGAAAAAPAPAAAPPAATGSVTPSSAYEQCVIAAESGGNAGAVNPSSGAGGLYQFLPSTWQSLGYSGSPQDASPATQQQAFNQLYAQQGSAPWSSDGCG